MTSINTKHLTLTQLQYDAYEAFKLHWMISHGYTVADLLGLYSNYWGDVESDTEGMCDFWKWLEDTGFNGELWPCFKEFLDHEFRDGQLMIALLPPNQRLAYLQYRNQIMSTTTKPMFAVKKDDVLLYNGCRYMATSDAYMGNTDIGQEWMIEVDWIWEKGTETQLYASYYANGEAQVLSDRKCLSQAKKGDQIILDGVIYTAQEDAHAAYDGAFGPHSGHKSHSVAASDPSGKRITLREDDLPDEISVIPAERAEVAA